MDYNHNQLEEILQHKDSTQLFDLLKQYNDSEPKPSEPLSKKSAQSLFKLIQQVTF